MRAASLRKAAPEWLGRACNGAVSRDNPRRHNMFSSRRGLLAGSAALAGGALAGCASPSGGTRAGGTPFEVAAPFIPIVGSQQVFPVRRIYCIGRNYAAHAREM